MGNDSKPQPKQLPTPKNFDAMFPGRYLKSGLLEGEVTLEIESLVTEDLGTDGEEEARTSIKFRGAKRRLMLNVTNAKCVAAMFGKKLSEWTGKRITIYPTTCMSFGKREDCIRVRGSPDISKPIKVTVGPTKRPEVMTLIRTATGANPPPSEDPPADEPGSQG